MKLSDTQRSVLERVLDGEVIHFMRGLNCGAFWHGKAGKPGPRTDTVVALWRAGLLRDIEKPEWRWRGSSYVISDRGRAALEGK